jgi:nucleoid DNA-binding protein
MRRVSRIGLAKAIQKKSGNIPLQKVYQAIGLIVEQMASDLIKDQVVTVRCFGTFSPYVRQPHLAHDVHTGLVRDVKSSRSVKFHPHEAFKELIRVRQKNFHQSDDDNS